MATKKGRAPLATAVAKPDTSSELRIEGPLGQTSEQRIAAVALGPITSNALTALTFSKRGFGPIGVQAAVGTLHESVKAVQGGALGGAEALLMSQATALNAIFGELAVRAHSQENIKSFDTLLRLAMKAQNQCRMTLETLAVIKNPPVVFARQANIANGPLQVNNGVAKGPATHAAKLESEQSGLLEANDGERMDTTAEGTAIGVDPGLEAVGAIHRPMHRKR